MKTKQLGSSSINIVPFVLGGNVFGWTIDEKKSFEVLDAFAASECNMIDTADVYSRWAPGNKGGESETIIGNWLQQRNNRSQIIIATKVGADMGLGKKCLQKDYILKAAEDSLKRLQTDYIDLYQTHWDDDETQPEETLSAYETLIKDGKVRFIGASNLTPQRLQQSLNESQNGLPKYISFQPKYNLYDREDFEKDYQQLCIKENIGVICYYGLASGFLTGKYRSEADFDKSQRGAGMKAYLNERGKKILAALDAISKEKNITQAAVALAWIINQPGITAPIASATSAEQLHELLQSVQIDLDEESMKQLNEASDF